MKPIVLIAPYDNMASQAQKVIEKYNFTNIDVVQGDMEDGLIQAAKAVEEGTKVIISRGSTCSLIKYVSPVPVVEVGISAFDMTDAVKVLQNENGLIAVVGYGGIMSCYDLLKAFGKKVVKVILDDKVVAEKKIEECISLGASIIIGDALTCSLCRKKGWKHLLVESGENSLKEAINEAQQLLVALYREYELVNRYSTLIDSVHEGVLATDISDSIVAVNKNACRLFSMSQKDLIGRNLESLKTYGAVIEEISNGVYLNDEVRVIGNTKIEISNYPIKVNGQRHGSIAVFQDLTEFQTREKNIRMKLVQKGLVAKYSFNTISYKSKKMDDCIRIAKKISAYDSTVLIEGESGTGKELFAQSIHNESRRRFAPFVAINCAALAPTLIESVLFGYVEGAFTGGSKGGKEGVFEMADTGTLFLDEIGELPLELQGRLLRVVQEHEVMRIGGDKIIPLDVRLICATNRNLEQLSKEGRFRKDLLYRINNLKLCIPPLNQRDGDIELLSQKFLHMYSSMYAKNITGFTQAALDYLNNHRYEGNVRELQGMIERAVIICEGEYVTVNDFCMGISYDNGECIDNDIEQQDMDEADTKSLKDKQTEYIMAVYERNNRSVSKTCEELGINRSTLWRRLKQ